MATTRGGYTSSAAAVCCRSNNTNAQEGMAWRTHPQLELRYWNSVFFITWSCQRTVKSRRDTDDDSALPSRESGGGRQNITGGWCGAASSGERCGVADWRMGCEGLMRWGGWRERGRRRWADGCDAVRETSGAVVCTVWRRSSYTRILRRSRRLGCTGLF